MKKRIYLCFMLSVFLLSSLQLDAAWVLNGCPSCRDEDSASIASTGDNVDVIKGASSFIESYSNILILLNESELSDVREINFEIAKTSVSNALEKIILSYEHYSKAFDCPLGTPIDAITIDRLKRYDYNSLVESLHLNPCIMEKVSSFLQKGDMDGMYKYVLKELEDLIVLTRNLQDKINAYRYPNIDELRKVYQKYSDFMNFGYYSSLVYQGIKQNNSEKLTFLGGNDEKK